MTYTRNQVIRFCEESLHYTLGSIGIDHMLEYIGATTDADLTGLGKAIDGMQLLSDNFDTQTLNEAKRIMEEYQINFNK